MRARLLLGVLLFAAMPVCADELDLSFNADAFRLIYALDLREGLRVDGGWLHHQDNGDAIHAGLQLVNQANLGPNPVIAGVGGRVVYTDGDRSSQDGFALAVGGSLRYTLPRYNRFSLEGEVFFAPDVLSTGDMEQYREGAVRVAYSITQQARVYVGARYLRGDYDDVADVRFDTGMHLGVHLQF